MGPVLESIYLKKINDQILSFKIGLTNNFLIKLSGGYLLIDTNYYHKYEQFLKELKSEKISPEEISYIFLTHHHDDHAGLAKRFLLNSQAKLIVHNNAIPFLKGGSMIIEESIGISGFNRCLIPSQR